MRYGSRRAERAYKHRLHGRPCHRGRPCTMPERGRILASRPRSGRMRLAPSGEGVAMCPNSVDDRSDNIVIEPRFGDSGYWGFVYLGPHAGVRWMARCHGDVQAAARIRRLAFRIRCICCASRIKPCDATRPTMSSCRGARRGACKRGMRSRRHLLRRGACSRRGVASLREL